MSTCSKCHGLGRVFICPLWPECGCPTGAILPECPGRSIPCDACDVDLDLKAWEQITDGADAPIAQDPTPSALHIYVALGVAVFSALIAATLFWWL